MAGGRDFRMGDRVVCRSNDPALNVRNGTCATVTGLDADRGLLTVQTDAGALCELLAGYAAEHLDHGYALTGHAAQGATVRRAFVLLRGEGALAEWAYVACSRAREETRLYGAAPELDLDAHARTPRGPAPRSLVTALGRSATEMLALGQVDRSREGHAPVPATRERLEPKIDAREGCLAEAHARLEDLGFLGRARHGRDLREVIGTDRRLLNGPRSELAHVQAEDVAPQSALFARSAARRARERSAPSPERGIGLEL